MKNINAKSILVGYTENLLIVAEKNNGEVPKIINAFEGDEARDLWARLTEKNNGGEN